MQSKCSWNFIKICKTVILIVAACTRTACMFPWTAIFLHLLQKYFSISCKNLSPPLAEIFLNLLLGFPPWHPLAPHIPAWIGSFWRHNGKTFIYSLMDAKEIVTLFGFVLLQKSRTFDYSCLQHLSFWGSSSHTVLPTAVLKHPSGQGLFGPQLFSP